jgi:hypothetical protein
MQARIPAKVFISTACELQVKYNFGYLTVFDRRSIIATGRVAELKRYFTAACAVYRHLTQTLTAIVRVGSL